MLPLPAPLMPPLYRLTVRLPLDAMAPLLRVNTPFTVNLLLNVKPLPLFTVTDDRVVPAEGPLKVWAVLPSKVVVAPLSVMVPVALVRLPNIFNMLPLLRLSVPLLVRFPFTFKIPVFVTEVLLFIVSDPTLAVSVTLITGSLATLGMVTFITLLGTVAGFQLVAVFQSVKAPAVPPTQVWPVVTVIGWVNTALVQPLATAAICICSVPAVFQLTDAVVLVVLVVPPVIVQM